MSIRSENLNLHYNSGAFHALRSVTMSMPDRAATALFGPSGCGKSSYLRCFNRMNDFIEGVRIDGKIMLDDQDIHAPGVDPAWLRRSVGMVFQKPNPFPKSIYDNVAYGPRIHGLVKTRAECDEIVEKNLRRAALWDEVKDALGKQAVALSGGQQQRLCIARAIAVNPRALLMDEPTSALDPIAAARIEELILALKRHYCVVIVTHSLSQAARISDHAGFFHLGDLVEKGDSATIFSAPQDKRTQDYIEGRTG